MDIHAPGPQLLLQAMESGLACQVFRVEPEQCSLCSATCAVTHKELHVLEQ
jgi:hypothetical protein